MRDRKSGQKPGENKPKRENPGSAKFCRDLQRGEKVKMKMGGPNGNKIKNGGPAVVLLSRALKGEKNMKRKRRWIIFPGTREAFFPSKQTPKQTDHPTQKLIFWCQNHCKTKQKREGAHVRKRKVSKNLGKTSQNVKSRAREILPGPSER